MATPTKEQGEYISCLEDIAGMIQKAQINLKKCPKQRLTLGYVKARIQTIDDYWESFKSAHYKLTKCTSREKRGELPYFLNEEFYKFEELYLCLKADLTDLLAKPTPSTSDTSESSLSIQTSLAKLPRIELKTFSGKYEDWPSFQDLFTALVHHTSLPDVQKLHYLKSSVSGEAEMLLRNIQITESNYVQAWDLLKERFGNKRMIINSVLRKLFGQKKIYNPSATQIKTLLDNTIECLNSLQNLKIDTDSWDPIIIFLVSQKLDSESLKSWEENAYKKNGDDMPTWKELKEFLEAKFRTLELVAPITSAIREKQPTQQRSYHITAQENKEDNLQSAHTSTNIKHQPICTFCKDNGHYIYQCKEFGKGTVEQRHEFVRNNNLCFNCLIPNHNVYNCRQRTTCRVCRRKHHSLLHQVQKEITKKESDIQSQPEREITTAHFSKEQPGHQVLLATAQVKVKSRDGDTHILRALIDQGSEASFVSARAVELLGLTRTNINGKVSGVGEGKHIPLRHSVDISVTSRFNENETIRVKAYVLKNISTQLPSKHITIQWTDKLTTLNLADSTYSNPGKIDLLLGAEIFSQIIEEGLIKLPSGIIAQKTTLGWILSGQKDEITVTNNHTMIALHITSVVAEDNDMLKRFWEIESEFYQKKKILTREEEMCEQIYKLTTTRDSNGRYKVHLPLKQSIEETVQRCGDTKQQALNRFGYLEKRFQRDPKLKLEYTNVMREYLKMGHMKISDTAEANSIYLPHHAVIREDKETTKIRVVYDASAKGSNGNSLNACMLIGPVLQPDLRSLIISWRTHKICVIGDIIKMYRMIDLTEEHTNLQRIVWREDPNEKIESYNLTTVTFGTAAAPYLAVRTLNQLADDEAHEFPTTAPVIKRSFYMDDLMIGNENVDKTIKMCDDIRTILQRGGFETQKWSSNSDEVLSYLQRGEDKAKDTLEIKLDKIIKILGLTWDRKDDLFKVTVNLPDNTYPVTKRSILSDIARLFDPFGWLAPVIITAKVFIQRLWLCSLGWDDELPQEMIEEWTQYRDELRYLHNTSIPRWLKTIPENHKHIQLHGFADASTQAYAAVTYLKILENDKIHITMIAARTKVAPVKQISVPKLELCAAALLAELINDIMEILCIPKKQVFAWTDSMVVLSWLQSQPSRWRTFVANRVADITRIIDNDRWGHVQSADNAADVATRGLKACYLADCESWWTGPEWLKQRDVELVNHNIPQTALEIKTTCHTHIDEKPIWERFSTISKMKRVLAYCRRPLRKEGKENYLTPKEMEKILELCIKYYQNLVYQRDIEELKKNTTVRKNSSLITLSPFLDKKGLIRVGGRLQKASVSDYIKHPIIIPANQHITRLLINEAHLRTLHGGIQQMMTYIRSKYWVMGIKSAVRKCIHTCKTCIIDKAKIKPQFMGQLPAVRVNQHRAFLNSGVDFAGPVWIRTSKGRGYHATKGYICLFVCMATRAIHLEAVTDLTTQAFMAAFRRFVARRGHCLQLWSDNASNFTCAAKELRELFRRNNDYTREVAELLANDGTKWHFIPPRMPNCGGLWEAGVQSAKRHLTRINKDTKLTYEEMATLLAQVEACLNSRPLCQIDNMTTVPLTPGHFLIGEPLISVPDIDYEDKKINLLTRWQMIQKMTQDFWHRWRTEYLHTLQQKYKWQVKVRSPAVGDIVIIKDEMLPPTKWLLGRIKYLHTGDDNLVRVVTVQCKGDQELKRPLSKIIPLPKSDDYNESN